MATRPTDKPEFASLDQVDGTSGQNNAVEPTASYKNYGFVYQENPVRQFFNWLFRNIHLWVDWLDQQEQDHESRISTNESDIATNVSDIATNVSDIATNTADIATNVSDIATNVSDIATNTADIATNTADISSNDLDIAINVADIATNTADIATNVSDIATNTADIATNDGRLDAYDADTVEYSGSMTLEESGTNSVTVNYLAYVKRIRGSGNTMEIVELWIPASTFTSTTQYLLIDGTSIPAALRPEAARESFAPILAHDNSSYSPYAGVIELTNTGDWNIRQYDGSNFTTSGTKGLSAQMVRYIKSIT